MPSQTTAHRQLADLRSRIDPPINRWRRRLWTIPAWLAAWFVSVPLTPVALPILATMDLLRGQTSIPLARAWLMLVCYLTCEVFGIVASAALWLFVPADNRLAAYAALQRAWSNALFTSLRSLFSITLTVDGLEQAQTGPYVLCVRHASTADTLLAAYLIANRTRLLLRYVLKVELLVDPCLDIVGGILPNAFVQRGGRDRDGDLQAITALGTDLSAGEGALIFPEGTRVSESKRQRYLERLRVDAPDRYQRLSNLQSTLPPRPGGVLTLLRQTDCDVVFLAHRGFENTTRFSSLTNGSLVGSRIDIRIWRCARSEIPLEDDERLAWLDQQWLEVDRWVTNPGSGSDAGEP